MLRSDIHRFYLSEADIPLIESGVLETKASKIQLLDKPFLFNGVIEIVQSEEKITQYLWPEADYNELNVIYKYSKNYVKMANALIGHKEKLIKIAELHVDNSDGSPIQEADKKAFSAVADYYAHLINITQVKELIEPAIMYQRMLSHAKEIFDNHLIVDDYPVENGLSAEIRSFAVYDYINAELGTGADGYAIVPDVLCAAQHQTHDVGVAVLVAEHLIDQEAPGREVAGQLQLARLGEHDLGHAAVDLASEAAEAALPLLRVGGVDHVIALLELFEELAHLVGGGLPVVVEADDIVARGVAQPAHQGRVLAEVFGQVDRGDARVLFRQAPDHPEGAVGRAVVDQHQLPAILGQGRHGLADLRRHAADRMLRAVAGDHEGYQFLFFHHNSSSSRPLMRSRSVICSGASAFRM